MLESASAIISQYLDTPASRYSFRHYEMARIDVEEFLYLCQVKDNWYIVYETDFLDDLPRIATEVLDIYGEDFRPIHWLPKKSSPDAVPLVSTTNKDFADMSNNPYVYNMPNTYLRYMVLAVEPARSDISRPAFSAYGSA